MQPQADELQNEDKSSPQFKVSALPLVRELCQALKLQGIVYCQWKGHWKHDRWASGEGDLDILVSRVEVQRFTSILCQLGFKQALPPPERQTPGILSYYGFDTSANKFVHVHVYYQLVVGQYWTINYRLPIEKPFLESAVQRNMFQAPAPEFELMVFALRMVQRYSILNSLCGRQPVWTAVVQKELDYLEKQVEPAKMHCTLKQHLPNIDAIFFHTCLESLRPGCSNWKRLRVRNQLHTRLKAHARRRPAFQILLALGRRVITTRGRVFLESSRKHLASGGAIIALAGGDGAGKSTSVDELYVWLSKEFETMKVHIGKPTRSLLTLGVAVARRIVGLFGSSSHKEGGVSSLTETDSPGAPSYLRLLRSVCIARDRYRLYVKARRFAMGGGVVICDRYPLSQIQLMDGPTVKQSLQGATINRVSGFLLRAEAWYYQQILPPELLVVLKVDPETAVRRKTNEEAAYVRARSREIWEANWQGTRVRVIDASRPKADVLSELQSLVWSEL